MGVTGNFDNEVVGALGKDGLGVKFVCHNGAWLVHYSTSIWLGADFAGRIHRPGWRESKPFIGCGDDEIYFAFGSKDPIF